MELLKKNINMSRNKQKMTTQISENEDVNLPDYMPDIEKIVQETGEVIPERIEAMQGKILIKGMLKYNLLYVGEDSYGHISAFIRETPFEEEIHMQSAEEHDDVQLDISQEKFEINIINSRKINVKMIIELDITVSENVSESMAVDVEDDADIQKKFRDREILQLKNAGNDIFRFHDTEALPKDKPNIEELIYQSIEPREMELRCDEGYISIDGRIHVFVLYTPEEQSKLPQWVEYEFPVQGKVECNESEPGMIGDLQWNLYKKELEVKEDSENEPRILSIDGVIEVSMKIYEEENIRQLEDVYATDKVLMPVSRPVLLSKLLMKNNSVCKLVKRMKVSEDSFRVLQICNIEGTVKPEKITPEGDILSTEGHVFVKMLYVTDDEAQPFRVAKGVLPFSHNVEVMNLNDKCSYRIRPLIESISANMADLNEIEIHVQIAMDVLVFDCDQMNIIDEIGENEMSKDEIRNMPGMVGYIAGEGETLWDIAKRYFTTVDDLKNINKLSDEEIGAGQKILITKKMARL